MDSINGPSEKNQPKKKVEVSFEKKIHPTGMQELELNDLPLNIQEDIRSMMETFDMTEAPSVYSFVIPMEYDQLPIDLLANEFKDAILEEDFEEAQNLSEEIKKRNYSIEITKKMISLTYNK